MPDTQENNIWIQVTTCYDFYLFFVLVKPNDHYYLFSKQWYLNDPVILTKSFKDIHTIL